VKVKPAYGREMCCPLFEEKCFFRLKSRR